MIVGYLRVSTERQHPANQQDEIRRFAKNRNWEVDVWVTEVVSGKTRERDRKLGTLLRRMKRGDTLVVTEISRLSRTLTDIMSIMGRCLKKQINLYTTKEGYTFDNTINSKVLCFAFGLVAEIERNLISMRTKEALARRKAEGVVLGRRKGSFTKLNVLVENRLAVIRMLDEDRSVAQICRRYDLSRDTFDRFRRQCPSVREAFERKEARRAARFAVRTPLTDCVAGTTKKGRCPSADISLPFCRDSVGIRTQDPQLRRLLLYPTELRNRHIAAPGRTMQVQKYEISGLLQTYSPIF